MPQKFTGRVILILTLLLLAVIVLLPPGSLFNSKVPWKSKINLKPGIDMAGGTRLIYEIKSTGNQPSAELVEQVMNSLKKRVDPDGVRNLVWRPQSGNRLEIQMPLTGSTDEAKKLRDTYLDAQKALDATNVRFGEVRRAVEKLKGDNRLRMIQQLAQGSAELEKLMGGMASTYDLMQAAEKAKDFAKVADAEVKYDNYKAQIEKLNLTSGDLEAALTATEETQKKRVGELHDQFKGFDARIKAIDNFATAYKNYLPVRGQLDDAGELKRLLKGSGVLSFHIMVSGQELDSPLAREMRERLNPGGKGIAPQANDQMRWFQVDRPEELRGQTKEYNDKFWALAWTTPEKSMVNRAGQPQWSLQRAYSTSDQLGLRAVGFEFNAEGAVRFGELTAGNINQLLGALLDDKVISAATINSVISASGIITRGSGYTDSEFRYLINTLNAGSLPAQLSDQPISEQTVGPSIGQDNLRRGLYSCMAGLVVVTIFLISYYYFAGIVATFAVLLNMVFILAAMAALDATFTLPGVAGIVLTIGMAVDANVLIFERLREEQQRGLSLRMALRNAYDRAFSAIFDSNVTTAITAGILYVLGSEEVKGFGLTLMLGMFSSLFTALFVTKTIFGLMLDKGNMKKLSSLPLTFPKWDQFLRPKIDWMKLAPWFYTVSVLFIGTGLVLFSIRLAQGKLMDIEFASGTSITFDLSSKMSIDEVREAVDKIAKQKEYAEALPRGGTSVVSVGTQQLTYEVVTSNPKGAEVKKAVIAAMGDKLKIERASEFEGYALPIDQARAQNIVVPITEDFSVDGVSMEKAYLYQGGVAFVLRDMQPPLLEKDIRDRIERQRLQPAVGTPLPYREIDVEMIKSAQAGHPDTAIVMIADPRLSYADDKDKWQSELAAPLWQLIHDGISRPEELQKITNFDPQVAASTSMRALVALGLSVLVITAYIWIRFGNLKFGSATVIACFHDTFFTLASIGFAQFLANTTIGDALLLEPFRINLTLVAAVLAVLGYSMNDTIVVFDRIRENRGKRGDVDRGIINDSINETLSRTLLTSGTTLATMFVMYIWGGPGVHGFTFVLLGGILVGTYSSVAIAAPMLLIGTAKEPSGNPSRKATKASAD